jgi:hypothetical protein
MAKSKPIKTVKRFVVGWGRKGDRLTFFIQHKRIENGKRIPTNPEDLQERLTKFATRLDGGKPKRV